MENVRRISAVDQEAYESVDQCRICGAKLNILYNFGLHYLSGVFPSPGDPDPPKVPLTLWQCKCGLIQLGQTVLPDLMFKDGYGYLSGLNPVMEKHLSGIVRDVLRFRYPKSWLDIGCNDGTLLKSIPNYIQCVGYDPVAHEIPGKEIIKDYFSLNNCRYSNFDVVTSIAMFYDLDNPVWFATMVKEVLAKNGIWILEVADGARLPENWDGVCHEHLAYYTEVDIERVMDFVGLRVFLFKRNEVNGGSIQAWICHENNNLFDVKPKEKRGKQRIDFSSHIDASINKINDTVSRYQTVDVYGASTKGNTLLQSCYLRNIRWAADRNPDKIGKRTPGTGILIVSEEQSRMLPPDAYLVLPWHFKDAIIKRERDFSGDFIFPLPKVEIWNGR